MLLLLLSVSLAFLKSGFLLGAIFLLLAADLFVHAVAPESAWMARCVLFGLVLLASCQVVRSSVRVRVLVLLCGGGVVCVVVCACRSVRCGRLY